MIVSKIDWTSAEVISNVITRRIANDRGRQFIEKFKEGRVSGPARRNGVIAWESKITIRCRVFPLWKHWTGETI